MRSREGMGWIERFIALAGTRSPMAPEGFHELVALHAISSVLGRSIYMQFGSGTIYPNIWGLMLGESGVTRKTTTKAFGEELLTEIVHDHRLSDTASPEGMIAELAEKSANGICHVWTIQDEFGRVISSMKHKEYMSDMKDMLMQLYDGKPISRRLAKASYHCEPIYMTFLSATTESRLGQLLKPEDLEDGFFPRFLVRVGSTNGWKSRPLMTLAMLRDLTDLKSELKRLHDAYANGALTEMEWSPEAKDFYDAWCTDLYHQVRCGEFPGAASARLEDYFCKLAILWEVSDRMDYLGARHVIPYERAVFIAERIKPYADDAARMFEQLGHDRYIESGYRVIASAGVEGISHKWFLRRTGLSAKRAKEVIDTLIESGRIEDFEVYGAHGPPARWYRAVRQTDA